MWTILELAFAEGILNKEPICVASIDALLSASGDLSMTQSKLNILDPVQLRLGALSRWDNEGGAIPRCREGTLIFGDAQSEVPPLMNAELVQLRIRVIALENLVISLLSQSSDRQLDLVREMAAYISPRPGFTPHHLTIRAAAEMIHLVERATHFKAIASPMNVPAAPSPTPIPPMRPQEAIW